MSSSATAMAPDILDEHHDEGVDSILEVDAQALREENLKLDSNVLRNLLTRGVPLDDEDLIQAPCLPEFDSPSELLAFAS